MIGDGNLKYENEGETRSQKLQERGDMNWYMYESRLYIYIMQHSYIDSHFVGHPDFIIARSCLCAVYKLNKCI